MRYIVKAMLKEDKGRLLRLAIDDGSLGKGSIAGGEYIRNMHSARLLEDGTATWIEVCFCTPPLAEERPYWEEYFQLLQITDAVSRRICKHETGEKPWACKTCTCTLIQEKEMEGLGKPFYQSLTGL
jgi:hypothetical protein